MASANPFDLLGDFDNDDPSQLIAAAQQLKAAVAPKKTPVPSQQKPAQAKMPSKPLPPAEAVREAKSDGPGRGGRGGGRGFSRGRGRGVGFNRDSSNNETAPNGVSGGYAAVEDGDIGKPFGGRGSFDERPRGAYRGGRRGGFNNGELGDGERPRRQFERRSGTGRGNELKRDGSGRGNWGSSTDEIDQESEEVVNANEKNLIPEKQPGEEDAAGGNKENTVTEVEDKELEEKEMTLEEYEKVLEEKRKALQALKAEERKVPVDKELESMQQLSSKKANNDIFIKLGSDKDKRKEIVDREEKGKKSVNLNAFRKPSEAESFYSGGRGRGRGGRGYRGGFAGGSNTTSNVPAPRIEDQDQFPSLGGN